MNAQNSGVFTIKASGQSGEAEISFQAKDNVELFECASECGAKYRFESVHGFLKALGASSKVCLRMNEEGLLSAQFLMEGGGVETFLEFTVAPLVED
jgi:cell cycle checkpoint protein